MQYKIKIKQQGKEQSEEFYYEYLDARSAFYDIAHEIQMACSENDEWFNVQLIDNDNKGSVIMTRKYPETI